MRPSRETIIYVLAISLVLAAALVSGAGTERPSLGVLKEKFDYIRAWGEFGISVDRLATGDSAAFTAASLKELAGGSVSQAVWDGTSLQFDDKGASWRIPLSLKGSSSANKAYLVSTWAAGSAFPWGVASLGIEGGLADPKATMLATVNMIGSEVVSPGQGPYAVMKSSTRGADGLYTYLLARMKSAASGFKPSSIKKSDVSAGLVAFQADLSGSKPLIGAEAVELTLVKAAADADAAALAAAWVESAAKPEGKRPDVRLTGMVDKPKVMPKDVVKYTYYLFNAGMDIASGLSVSIPIPAGGNLVAGSVSGDSGKATLKPSAVVVDLEKGPIVASSAYEGTREIKWDPSGNLRPGEVMKFSFEFMVK